MEVSYTSLPIADYVAGMAKKDIIVNKDYQRSDEVWPDAANSFLIETILLRYPMPKLSLRQITELQRKSVYKEIVDGQQRSRAIKDFFDGKLRLSKTLRTERFRGRVYDELEKDDKETFLAYQLNVDLYLGTTNAQVREIFRRINSYTIPLNPEEQRHAEFQGPMKWFINSLTEQYDEAFAKMGVFSEKQLVRMADTKLVAELIHALENGITTTNANQLRKLYEQFDVKFPRKPTYSAQITQGLDDVIAWRQLHSGGLMRPYQVYSLVLAVIHVRHRLEVFQPVFPLDRKKSINERVAVVNLSRLAAALDDGVAPQRLKSFIDASAEKTNVKKERQTRFVWFCRALTEASI